MGKSMYHGSIQNLENMNSIKYIHQNQNQIRDILLGTYHIALMAPFPERLVFCGVSVYSLFHAICHIGE